MLTPDLRVHGKTFHVLSPSQPGVLKKKPRKPIMNVNVTVIPVCPQFVSSFRKEVGGDEKEIQATELPIRFTKGGKNGFLMSQRPLAATRS